MKPLKKRISVTLDEEIIEKIKISAKDSYRSFSGYINWVLRKHLAEENKQQ